MSKFEIPGVFICFSFIYKNTWGTRCVENLSPTLWEQPDAGTTRHNCKNTAQLTQATSLLPILLLYINSLLLMPFLVLFFLYIPLVSDYFIKIMHNLQFRYNSQQVVKLIDRKLFTKRQKGLHRKHTNTCVVVRRRSRSVCCGRRRDRKPKETLDRRRWHSGPRIRRTKGWFVVCQAAQLNRNNDLHVSSLHREGRGRGCGWMVRPRGSSGLTEARGVFESVGIFTL